MNRLAMAAAVLVGIAVFFTTGERSRLLLVCLAALGFLFGLARELGVLRTRR